MLVRLRSWQKLFLMGFTVWTLTAVAGLGYAAAKGKPAWPTVVTLDEWVVAIGLIAWFLFTSPIGARKRELKRRELALVLDRLPMRFQGPTYQDRSWMRDFLVILLVVFLLDLGVRAVFSLGWRPF